VSVLGEHLHARVAERLGAAADAGVPARDRAQLLVVDDLPPPVPLPAAEPEGPPRDQHTVVGQVDEVHEGFAMQLRLAHLRGVDRDPRAAVVVH
jgi:hypothetical protein